ncbi:CRISPR-associated endonuclease Cas2 [Rarobacter incanus]|uniref:CRISPR-associated endoribonuclease Cas2 n=1 Tax=Rarobacter incanus TaxID=153494 RepID=A0A542SPQ9_9MICO|nr:CRISPR-associated protein Cas2 [Rarobacter incanus]
MWAIVMFDLPVQTKEQRREATAYRHLLKDLGFQMVQLSVYARYSVTSATSLRLASTLSAYLPKGGEVRILRVTDRQWSQGFRFCNGDPSDIEQAPAPLLLF